MSNTVTLYKTWSFDVNADPKREPIDAVAWEKVGEFRKIRWCTTHDSKKVNGLNCHLVWPGTFTGCHFVDKLMEA